MTQKHGNSRKPQLNRATTFCRLTVALALHSLLGGKARAEDHVDYRYGLYKEDDHRIEINTHSALFEKKITDTLAAKGEFVYDGISGATPTGSLPRPGSDTVPLVDMSDIRRAGNLELDWAIGRHTLSPQVAYSEESDYTSFGISLNDAIEFNQKNTTLRIGASQSFDSVEPVFFTSAKDKNSTDVLLGVSQLLSAKTIFTADFTYGYADGYLSDPYKQIDFSGWVPFLGYGVPQDENRPGHRSREVLQLTLTHFFDPAAASAELAYRFHHDSFGIESHTVGIAWHQKLGSRVTLSPAFRFYEQSAADFYYLTVPGFTPNDGNPNRPEYYSADYRLSHMMTLTYGVQVTARLTDWLQLDAGYQRYEMSRRDGVSPESAYPNANVFNVGLRLWF